MKTPKLVGNLGPKGVLRGERLWGKDYMEEIWSLIMAIIMTLKSRVGRAWGRALCLTLLLLIRISFLPLHYFILFPN